MLMVSVSAGLPNCHQTNDVCSDVVGENYNGTFLKRDWKLLASVQTTGGDYGVTESAELFAGSKLVSDLRVAWNKTLSKIGWSFSIEGKSVSQL